MSKMVKASGIKDYPHSEIKRRLATYSEALKGSGHTPKYPKPRTASCLAYFNNEANKANNAANKEDDEAA
jgi:hypothetical protein